MKRLIITFFLFTALTVTHSIMAQKKITQTAGQTQLGDLAPKFAELNDDVLFGEVWNRPGLSAHDNRPRIEEEPCTCDSPQTQTADSIVSIDSNA